MPILQRVLTFCLASALLFAQAPESFAKAQGISVAAIKDVVQQSDALNEENKEQVFASYTGGIASVSLFRHPDATKGDCKIDAVLLARKIIALAPKEVRLVRCVFYDSERQNEFWEVEVRAQLISAFARGEIGERDLMNSLLCAEDKQKNPLSEKFASLSYSGILDFDSVCKGSCEDRRLAIHLRLEELERQKIDVSQFRDDFLHIEDTARRGKEKELPDLITELNKSLDKYEQEMIDSGQLQKQILKRAKNSTIGRTN